MKSRPELDIVNEEQPVKNYLAAQMDYNIAILVAATSSDGFLMYSSSSSLMIVRCSSAKSGNKRIPTTLVPLLLCFCE